MILSLIFGFFLFTPSVEALKINFSQENQHTVPKIQEKEIDSLNTFFQNNSPIKIHNQALHFLKIDQKDKALLLLKRNLYQNLFFPSYFVLSHFEAPLFLSPFLWHIQFLIFTLISLFLFFLLLKKPKLFYLKSLFFFLIFCLSLFISGLFLLKKRVSPLESIPLRSAPFTKAVIKTNLKPNSDLIVLKETKDWLRVQNKNNETGWILKQNVFQIF